MTQSRPDHSNTRLKHSGGRANLADNRSLEQSTGQRWDTNADPNVGWNNGNQTNQHRNDGIGASIPGRGAWSGGEQNGGAGSANQNWGGESDRDQQW